MNPAAMTSLRERLRTDDGASLMLTMIFVVGVGLVVTALLTYSQTGFIANKATATRHALASDASGAMDVAIDSLRKTDYSVPTTGCPVDNLSVPRSVGTSIRVTCKANASSGTAGGLVTISTLNRPGSAILTLGGASEAGLNKPSNGILRIKGRVYVNSAITVAGATCPGTNCSKIEVENAPVIAKGLCTPGKVFSTVLVTCSATGTPPEGMDPADLTDAIVPLGSSISDGYDPPPSAVSDLVHQIVPTCGSGLSVEFDPGYYDDADTLSTVTRTCNKPFHFRTGTYFFDFRNEEMSSIPSGSQPMAPAPNVWTVENSSANFFLVGGTKKDWNPTTGIPSNFPGSCETPLMNEVNQGVQFVFGGTSRMNVLAGKVELCGTFAFNRPPIVIYGAKSGTTTSVPLRTSLATTAATPIVTTPATQAFAQPDQALTANAIAATATISRPATSTLVTATERLTGMDAASQIPAGSILQSAELRVTHKESLNRPQDVISVSVLPNPGRAGATAPVTTTGGVAVNATAGYVTSTIPLTDALMREVWRYGLGAVQIDYRVSAGRLNGTNTSFVADLDSAQLWVSWKPPSLRGESTPINGSHCIDSVAPLSTCSLITTSGASTSLYLQGTTYAPLANFNINLTNISGQVFKSGVIARSLLLSVTPSATFLGPVIEIPDESSTGVTMEVYLSAFECISAPCPAVVDPLLTTTWRRIGQSTVSLESSFPAPTNGNRAVTVLSWHVLD